jgi:hypothetical protein
MEGVVMGAGSASQGQGPGLLTDTPGSRAPRKMDGVARIGKIAQRSGFSQRHGRPTLGKSGRKADLYFWRPISTDSGAETQVWVCAVLRPEQGIPGLSLLEADTTKDDGT